MRIIRAGLMFLPLVLVACSLPTKQTHQDAPSKEPVVDSPFIEETQQEAAVEVKEPTAVEPKSQSKGPSGKELVQQLRQQQKLALQNALELSTRIGEAPISPDTAKANASDSRTDLLQRIASLKEFNQGLSNEIVALDKRVNSRRDNPKLGDTLQIYLSDLMVNKNNKFSAQSLVGHWVRGESRVVRLNEDLLAENADSEPLRVTFSEQYQILINNKLIGSFGPDRSKYEIEFDAPTADEKGSIAGTLKIRIQSEQGS